MSKDTERSAIELALQITNACSADTDVEAVARKMLDDYIDDAEREEIMRAITIAHKIMKAGRASKAKHKGKGGIGGRYMTDTLTAADRAALSALGFTLTGTNAWAVGLHSRSGAARRILSVARGDAAPRPELQDRPLKMEFRAINQEENDDMTNDDDMIRAVEEVIGQTTVEEIVVDVKYSVRWTVATPCTCKRCSTTTPRAAYPVDRIRAALRLAGNELRAEAKAKSDQADALKAFGLTCILG